MYHNDNDKHIQGATPKRLHQVINRSLNPVHKKAAHAYVFRLTSFVQVPIQGGPKK